MISTTKSYEVVIASGNQDTFYFSLEFNDPSTIFVSVNGIRRDLASYVVNPNEDYTGGEVVMNPEPPEDARVVISRELLATQETDYPKYGPFPAEAHEAALDKLTMLIQQVIGSIEVGALQGTWNAEWIPNHPYQMNAFMTGLDGNIYVTSIAHTSGVFESDVAAGKLTLVLELAVIRDLAEQAAAAAEEATKAATDAVAAANSFQLLSNLVDQTEALIAVTAQQVANCAAAAYEGASRAEVNADRAEGAVSVGERTDGITQTLFTATAGQTVFTLSVAAPEGNLMVFMNSRKLRLGDDYTTNVPTAATQVILTTGAALDDELDVISVNTLVLGG